jgi:hypothetical protein
MKFYMTMESETATLLVQFSEMYRDDLVNDGTPCGLPCAIFRHTVTPATNHPPSSISLLTLAQIWFCKFLAQRAAKLHPCFRILNDVLYEWLRTGPLVSSLVRQAWLLYFDTACCQRRSSFVSVYLCVFGMGRKHQSSWAVILCLISFGICCNF